MSSPNDLSLVQEMYDLYVKAEKAVLTGQAYSIGDRTLTRVDLRWVVAEREKWGAKLTQLQSSEPIGIRVQRVVPRDRI